MQQLSKPQTQNQNLQKQRIPWKLKIQAKSKHFHLNFNFKSSSSSSLSFFNQHPPSSLLLNAKFLKCHLFLSSKLGSSSSSNKSKFFNFFRKLMPKKSKKSLFFPQKSAVKLQSRKRLWVGLFAAMLVSLIRYPLLKFVNFNEARVSAFLGNLWNYGVSSM